MFLRTFGKMKCFQVFLVLSLALIVRCGNDEGSRNATITGMNPNQVSIGQQNGVASITGTNLNATAVSLGDGIAVISFNVKSASEIEVHFNVNSNAAPGPRTISVTTTGGVASSSSALSVIDNHAPTAKFIISPTAGSLKTIFQFDAGGSTDVALGLALTYSWKFGDGATASGRKVTHKYDAIGSYNVELRVTDSQGGFGASVKAIEVLKNSPPIVRFLVRPGLKGDTNTSFRFDASASDDPDGRIADYIWDFGDGSRKKRGVEVDYVYDKAGNYTVQLTLIDNKGNAASDVKELEVEKSTQIVCQGKGGGHAQIVRGKVVAVEPGNWAIVDFGAGHNCGNTWHKCDDFRKTGGVGNREFFGIVDKMTDRGNGIMGVHNACPLFWPPGVGDHVFLYYKTCAQNHCP